MKIPCKDFGFSLGGLACLLRCLHDARLPCSCHADFGVELAARVPMRKPGTGTRDTLIVL